MLEFIWHARGGQGAFTAARCLGAAAALSAGAYALAFPTFGPERRGAPMRAFTKIDTAPIGDRSAVHRAAYVIYLDETLVEDGWEDELAPGGLMLLNTKRALDDPRILGIDADGISAAVLGRPIPNTVFLGAIPALTAAVTIEDIHAGICATMPEKLHAKNLRIVAAAFAEVASREIAATRGRGEGFRCPRLLVRAAAPSRPRCVRAWPCVRASSPAPPALRRGTSPR